MAHNTVINPGAGGDTVCTYDQQSAGTYPTTGKIAAGVMYVSADASSPPSPVTDLHGFPVRVMDPTGQVIGGTNPLPVTIAGATATIGIGGTVAVAGTVGVSSLPALPAGTNVVGVAISPHQTGAIYSGTTALTPKFAVISAASSGNNTVVAAVTGKKIRVLRFHYKSGGTVNAKFTDGTNDLTGLFAETAGSANGAGWCPVGVFETGVGAALILNLSAAVGLAGVLTYCEV